MPDKQSAYAEGSKRGLEDESDSFIWGQGFGDTLINESVSTQARREGYEQGRWDCEFKKNS